MRNLPRRLTVSPSMRAGIARARNTFRRSAFRYCVDAPLTVRKRCTIRTRKLPSSMKSWQKNYGRMAMRLVNKFNLRARPHGRQRITAAVAPAHSVKARGPKKCRSKLSELFHTRASLFERDPSGAIYLPFAGGFQSEVFFHIRLAPGAARDAMATTDLLRRTIREVDSSVPILELKSFSQHLDSNLQLWLVRASATLFTTFGTLALVLAVVGVYGV